KRCGYNCHIIFRMFVYKQQRLFVKEVSNVANNNSNQLLVPGVEQALEQMKYEIAQEFGVNMGADSTSRSNGSVGGEIKKRLDQQAQSQMPNVNQNQNQ